jgi:UDPglucose 6-dehydrogenase
MNIAVIGTGYVGLVTGVCFSEMGINVTCVDINEDKIKGLNNGIIPIYEPGLEEMVIRNNREGRLHFITDLKECIDNLDIVFIAVGTPSDEDGSANLSYVFNVAKTIGQSMNNYLIVVTKSTVPVGTSYKVKEKIQQELRSRNKDIEFDVVSNPEFLKEGAAIKDFMSPDRVIVGVESERSKEIMSMLYRPFLLNNFRVIFMDILSAEMTKYASNAMLATRISFMNDIANLCELVGADVNMVRKGVGSDSRIGSKFLYPGSGYGGSCFPKDVKALIQIGKENGYSMKVIKAVEEVNEFQKKIVFNKIKKTFNNELKNRNIAIWGLSFKPETDDVRDAPSLVVIEELLKENASVSVYDPIAMDNIKKRLGSRVQYANDMYEALVDADALLLLTEWKQFRAPNWKVIKKTMKGNVIIDGRNIYDPVELASEGFILKGIGRA